MTSSTKDPFPRLQRRTARDGERLRRSARYRAARIRTAIAAALLAPAALIALTLGLAVNVPYGDEWDWGPLAYGARTGTLTLRLLLAPHNEHRNTLPNLIFLALDRVGGWNVVRETAFSLALLIVAQVLLWRIVRRNMPLERAAVAFAGLSIVLCGLGQWENVALGYNIGWNICTLGIVAIVDLLGGTRSTAGNVALSAVIACAASFSSAQGFLLWPCGVVLLIAGRARAAAYALWGAAAALTGWAFFADYHPDPVLVLPLPGPPTNPVAFALAYLGGALRSGSGPPQSVLFGGIALTVFAAALMHARPARACAAQRAAEAGWIAFAAYAILGACVSAAGRSRFGLEYALQSRYDAIALFLPLGTIGLVAAAWPRLGAPARRVWLVALPLLVALTLSVGWHGVRYLRMYDEHRRAELSALRRPDVDDGTLTTLALPDARKLRRILSDVRAVGDAPFAP